MSTLALKELQMRRMQRGLVSGIGANADLEEPTGSPAWRRLSRRERRILIRNGNLADDWSNLFVTEGFSPHTVRNSSFYGVNRINGQSRGYLEYNDLRLPVGITNSTIISCEIGRDSAVHNVRYLSRFLIGSQVILFNIDEMISTSHAVFGNGAVKNTKKEEPGGWIAVANENGGRKILPFSGLNVADAYLWSRHRDRPVFQENLEWMTEKVAAAREGRYGTICDNTVIKSCRIIRDIDVGEHAVLTGANKLENLTIKSRAESPTFIGEGVELETGIIDFGSRVFHGVKAIRFYLGTNTTLGNGARFIDSVLGDNSTVLCCEVKSSITFPFHELHHNNSFIIAATLAGLSNVGAGATIGSNHNSRAADGEFFAGRGFWPGLCVNVTFPSKIASFCLLAKGSYPAGLNIPLPFTLVSNNEKDNRLRLYPGYWFLHNMYGLGRNSWKLKKRDLGLNAALRFEHDYLAPDTVEELLDALEILEKWAGIDAGTPHMSIDALRENGRKKLASGTMPALLEIDPAGVEASTRGITVINIQGGYNAYREMIHYYGIRVLMFYMRDTGCMSLKNLLTSLGDVVRRKWTNLGGQLMTRESYEKVIAGIEDKSIASWDSVHEAYKANAETYPLEKACHALSALASLHETDAASLTTTLCDDWIDFGISLQEKILARTKESRSKDYQNEFRKMMYDSDEEMTAVLGNLNDNMFIKTLENETEEFTRLAGTLRK